MSLSDGLAAIHLNIPSRVPRTEYSADFHWPLVRRVTGGKIDSESSEEERGNASAAFRAAWNYDFVWNTYIFSQKFNGWYTKMGHAAYSEEGSDFSDELCCPFADPEDLLRFEPSEKFDAIDREELVSEFNDNYAFQRRQTPEAVNMTGIYTTLMSGLLELAGWDALLMAAGIDKKGFGDLANRYAAWMLGIFEALAESESDVVMIHDDIVWTSGAFIHPEWYRSYIFPNYKKLFAPVLESGKKLIYTSDGNYTQFIDDIAACGVHGFVLEPSTDMACMAEKYGRTHVIIGNADTRILQYGTRDDIRDEVKRCMDIGKRCPGFFMAVGNHIPVSVPVENALWYNECYEKQSKR